MPKQKPSTPPSPADAYFRAVFAVKEVAQQLVRFALRSELLERLDLSTLTLAPESFVDGKLRKSLSDLVYICRFKEGGTVRICLLFEHKSYPPGRLIYPQLNRYICGIQESDVKQKHSEFALTIPILFYHGEEEWTLKPVQNFYGNLPDGFSRFIPVFDVIVVNLQKMSRAEILAMRDSMLLRNVFLVLKKAWDDNFFKQHISKIVIFADKNVREEILFLLFDLTWYFIQQVSTLKEQELMEAVTTLPKKYGKRVKSTYEQIVETAAKRGKAEGRQEGIDSAIKRLMQNLPSLSDPEIATMFEVPLERVQRLRTEVYNEQS